MKKQIMIAIALLCIPIWTLAAPKPSSEEARKVMNYYTHGKGSGAVLVDYTLCTETGKDEENKNDCMVTTLGSDVNMGDEVLLWMNFMIPVDDQAKIIIAYSRNNRIRKTQEIVLGSAFRYRTWKKIYTETPGEWTIQIFQEMADKDIDLGSLTYTVK